MNDPFSRGGRFTMVWIFTVLLTLCAMAAGPQTPALADPADASTPTKAALALAKVMEAGDMTAAHTLAVGTDAEFAILKGFADRSNAFNAWVAASRKKFVEDFSVPDNMKQNDLSTYYKSLKEKITADTASLVNPDEPGDMQSPIFKKSGGFWKMDLRRLDENAEWAKEAKKVPGVVKVYSAVTKNIIDGKYKTAEEMSRDYHKRLVQWMMDPNERAAAPQRALPAKSSTKPAAPRPE